MPTRSLPTRHGHACFVWRLCGPWHVKAPQAARSPGRNKKNSTSAPAALTIHTAVAYETTPPTYTRKSGSKLPPPAPGLQLQLGHTVPRPPTLWADTVHVDSIGPASIRPTAGLGQISPKCGVCIPPKVFCSIWRYFEVSDQSQVSVRIEEAFQIHTNTRKIPITKKTKYRPGIGLAIPVSRYRSGDTSLTGIGLAIPVSRPIHDNTM